MERSQSWPSPLRLVLVVLLSLSLSSSWAAPLLLQLVPTSDTGMACCKRNSAHSCCKKKTPDGPSIVGNPPCGDTCKVRSAPSGPSLQTALLPEYAEQRLTASAEPPADSAPSHRSADSPERYQRPPPLA